MTDPTEDMRRRVVRRSCIETNDGVPECIGAAMGGEDRCTCDTIPKGEHDECVLVAHVHYLQRGSKACHDCAFRRGSPEMDGGQTDQILGDETAAFYCHQGMPIDARGRDPELGDYVPDDAHRYPVCAGWVAMRLARIYDANARSIEDSE